MKSLTTLILVLLLLCAGCSSPTSTSDQELTVLQAAPGEMVFAEVTGLVYWRGQFVKQSPAGVELYAAENLGEGIAVLHLTLPWNEIENWALLDYQPTLEF